jgi:hypothetical protein
MFKRPYPADFFRTMEDASAVDLDWFWKGWFYGIDAVDISLDTVRWLQVDLENNPQPRENIRTQRAEEPFVDLSKQRNREEGIAFPVEKDTDLVDFYSTYRPWETADSVQIFKTDLYAETFKDKEKQELFGNKNYYELTFSNKGGLVMPIVLEWTYKDGTKEIERIPAEIWRKNEDKFTKAFVKDKEVTNIKLDPFQEFADVDNSNDSWVAEKATPSRFQVYKQHKPQPTQNPMQKAKDRKVIRP